MKKHLLRLFTLSAGIFLSLGAIAAVKSTTSVGSVETVAETSGDFRERPVCPANLPAWDGTSQENYSSGTGTQADPFIITNGAQLNFLAKTVNAGTGDVYAGEYFKLGADINLNNKPFEGIGLYNSKIFAGYFDGDNHTIYNLYIFKKATSQNLALFGIVKNGYVKNLTVEGKVVGQDRIGGVVRDCRGSTIENVVSWVDIEAGGNLSKEPGQAYSNNKGYTGGVVAATYTGTSNNKIINCKYYGHMVVNFNAYCGGVVGYAAYCTAGTKANTNAQVINCENYGTIEMTNCQYLGGVVGIFGLDGDLKEGCILKDCRNYGDVKFNQVTKSNFAYAGGICGRTYKIPVENCENFGTIYSVGSSVGGIIGRSDTTTVDNCRNFGTLNADKSQYANIAKFAGIVGDCCISSVVKNCDNFGTINGNFEVGAICGYVGKGCSIGIENRYYNEDAVTYHMGEEWGMPISIDHNAFVTKYFGDEIIGYASVNFGKAWNPEPCKVEGRIFNGYYVDKELTIPWVPEDNLFVAPEKDEGIKVSIYAAFSMNANDFADLIESSSMVGASPNWKFDEIQREYNMLAPSVMSEIYTRTVNSEVGEISVFEKLVYLQPLSDEMRETYTTLFQELEIPAEQYTPGQISVLEGIIAKYAGMVDSCITLYDAMALLENFTQEIMSTEELVYAINNEINVKTVALNKVSLYLYRDGEKDQILFIIGQAVEEFLYCESVDEVNEVYEEAIIAIDEIETNAELTEIERDGALRTTIASFIENYPVNNYRDSEKTLVQSILFILNAANENIESREELKEVFIDAKTELAEVKTDAEYRTMEAFDAMELDAYKVEQKTILSNVNIDVFGDNRDAAQAKIVAAYGVIDAATSVAAVDEAVGNVLAELGEYPYVDSAETLLTEAKNEAITNLRAFDISKYAGENLTAVRNIVDEAVAAIEKANDRSTVSYVVAQAEANIACVAQNYDPASATKGGCGGSIAATSLILSLLAMAGAGIAVSKKSRKEF